MNERTYWIEEHLSIHNWLQRVAPSTRESYGIIAFEFFTWLEEQGGLEWTDKEKNHYIWVTPQELLDAQDTLQNKSRRERYKIVDLIQSWIQGLEGRISYKQQCYYVIRSFFAHNRVPLPRDRGFRPRGDKPPTHSTFTIDDIQKILLSSNELYQAVFTIIFQGGMGTKEFLHFNEHGWKQITEQLHKEKKVIRIDFPGRKHQTNERPFYTFIGTDAIEALKRYLKIRGPIKNGEAIFINKNGDKLSQKALQKYFRRHAAKIGVIDLNTPPCPECGSNDNRKKRKSQDTIWYKTIGSYIQYTCNACGNEFAPNEETVKELQRSRYGVSIHELRDLFRSSWETSPAKGVVAEFLMGHSIDPNNYNKFFKTDPDWVESQYRQAMPWLNILSEDPRKIPIDEVARLTEKTKEQNGIIQELKRQLDDRTTANHVREQELETLKEQLTKHEELLKKLFKNLEEKQ